MSDDWSLKGKLVHYVINVEDGRKSHIEESRNLDSEKWKILSSFYPKKDIETLRQKLIEDIQQYFDKLSEEYKEDFGYISSEIIEKIINKRFGVEKNE